MMNRFRLVILFLLSFLCFACNNKQKTTGQKETPVSQDDVIYCHSEAPIATVTMTEEGGSYEIEAVGGQVMLFFKDYVPHKDAVRTIEKYQAIIIAQIPYLKYYLVEVPVGKEGRFVSLARNVSDIDFVYPNIVGDICAATPFVVDNFKGDHGEKVAAMVTGCNLFMNITTYDVSPQGEERGISTHKAIESVEQTLKNLRKGNSAVFNMSFGPGLIKLWGIIPWQNRVLWDDRFVTDDNKKSYTRRYINGLKTWIKLSAKFGDKDFVVVKSAGNEGMKELETILDGLKNELSPQEIDVFERHFIIVSAKDDNKERDYPNDVSTYHKMVTKVDISDMTAQDLHWQGTSFSSPRVAGYITNAANDYNLKVVDILNHVRKATEKANDNILTYELLEKQIAGDKKYDTYDCLSYCLVKDNTTEYELLELYNTCDNDIIVKGTLLNRIASHRGTNILEFEEIVEAHKYAYIEGFIENECSIASVEKLSKQNDNHEDNNYLDNSNYAKDLVGQIVYEPSDNGYFPQEWRWKIEDGEVLSVQEINRLYGNDEIIVLAHLHRGETRIDAEMVLKYSTAGRDRKIMSSKVLKLIIPTQPDFSQYIKLRMDYDFLPSLVLYNKSDMTLFVGGDYSFNEGKMTKFAGVFEPNSSKTIAIGGIDSYHIHFAYRK